MCSDCHVIGCLSAVYKKIKVCERAGIYVRVILIKSKG